MAAAAARLAAVVSAALAAAEAEAEDAEKVDADAVDSETLDAASPEDVAEVTKGRACRICNAADSSRSLKYLPSARERKLLLGD